MSIYRNLVVWKHGDVSVVRFGEHRMLDELTVKRIIDELNAIAHRADCQNLVLNLAGVVGLSSLMLEKLLTIQHIMVRRGGKLRLCGIEPEVQAVFTTIESNHALDIRESEEDAIRAFAEVDHIDEALI
jgi:anti-anti-sigma factor